MVISCQFFPLQVNEQETYNGQYKNRELFSDIMNVLDIEWSTVTGDIELSVKLCCGLTGTCTLSVWDLLTKEIWNEKSNSLALLQGADDI